MDHHLDGIAIPADPSLAPDGARVAFTVSMVDVDEDRYVRRVWTADHESARPFTSGDGDSAARWSPDGSRLAFFRSVDDKPQLAVIEIGGGEASVVSNFSLGVSGHPQWSPDGESVAVVGVIWDEEWSELDDDERARKPRRITRRDYRGDQGGWTHNRHRFIYLVDPGGGEPPRRLTTGDRDELSPAWSPDGTRIAYLSNQSPTPGYEGTVGVFQAEVGSGQVARVVDDGMWALPAYRPDGVLHLLGSPGAPFPEHPRLWRIEDAPICLTDDLDRAVVSIAAGSPQLVFEGDTALVSVVDRGRVGVMAVDPAGSISVLHDQPETVTGFDSAAGTFAMTVSSVDSPGRLILGTGETAIEYHDFGGVVPDTVQPEHFTVEGRGGALDVWVFLPDGDQSVPLLLNIHGGPASQYGWGFFDEFQVYVEAGYGVVATNPRGSTGSTRDFLRAVMGDGFGTVDVEDIDVVVAEALDRYPRFDADRLGVMGGSYGGFLTAWLIGLQSRWKTAIVERALLSWPSFAGTSDIGGWFAEGYLGDPNLEWDRSPLRLADQVGTPTLIIHSENDFRCPIEQAEQYFSALLANGVHAEFIRFPGEGHELSRSGKPKHRQERFEIVLDWLARTL